MSWQLLIPIIAQYGIPWAYDLWKIVTSHPVPDEAAWEELLKMAEKRYEDYFPPGFVPPPQPPPDV